MTDVIGGSRQVVDGRLAVAEHCPLGRWSARIALERAGRRWTRFDRSDHRPDANDPSLRYQLT